ncbi:MAG: hypothetical protein KY475_21695, partial [Planctomycetes bacterium]|nr:hypothetical protein [Planctomycetota bacterium]
MTTSACRGSGCHGEASRGEAGPGKRVGDWPRIVAAAGAALGAGAWLPFRERLAESSKLIEKPQLRLGGNVGVGALSSDRWRASWSKEGAGAGSSGGIT